MSNRLVLEKLRKSYGDTTVVNGISLDVAPGELVVLVGPSGCGKSTLLRMVAGLLPPDGGRIVLGQRDITRLPPGQRDVAMVFQSYALYPHMSVYDNIAFPLRVRKADRAVVDARVREVAAALGLEPLLQRRPRELSGGQRQRVAMGRSLVRDPRLFLFDEPLSNLDAALRTRLRAEIAALHRRLDATMMYVTHDQHEAMTLADRMVLLRDGRIEQMGAPEELYARPASRFVASFLGSPPMSFVEAAWEPRGLVMGEQILPVTALGERQSAEVWLGLRPEDVELASEGPGTLKGRVVWVERTGADTFVHVELQGHTVVVRVGGGAAGVAAGEMVWLLPKRVFLFDRGTEELVAAGAL